jgi:hypothetical protein
LSLEDIALGIPNAFDERLGQRTDEGQSPGSHGHWDHRRY